MSKQTAARIAARIFAIALTARLTFTAYQHHMSILDTAVIALVALYTFTAGFTTLVDRRASTAPPTA